MCGKTRLRHEQFAKSHGIVDAGDIVELDTRRALTDAMTGAGYKTNMVVLECEWEEAQRWNLVRGPHNLSAYYTDKFNVKWLVEAAG